LRRAGGKVAAAESGARAVGPSLGTLLARWVEPVTALLAQAFSLAASAFALSRIRLPEPPKAEKRPGIRETLRYLFSHRIVRGLVLHDTFRKFFNGAFLALQVPLLVRELGAPEY